MRPGVALSKRTSPGAQHDVAYGADLVAHFSDHYPVSQLGGPGVKIQHGVAQGLRDLMPGGKQRFEFLLFSLGLGFGLLFLPRDVLLLPLGLGFCFLELFFIRLGGHHEIQNPVFYLPDFILVELNFSEERAIFLVSFHVEQLVVIFRDFLLEGLNVPVELSALLLVGRHALLHRGMGFGDVAQLFFDFSQMVGERSNPLLEGGDLLIELLKTYN